MNKQLTLSNAARFDLHNTGLTEAQLKTIAGARPADKTNMVTVVGTTKCCWGF